MSLNRAPQSRLYKIPGDYKDLSPTDLSVFSDGDTSISGIAFSAATLGIECDLGARHNLDLVAYYRTPAAAESLVFWGRQGTAASHPWHSLSFTTEGQGVFVDLRASENKYRFVRVEHTASEGAATAYELEIYTTSGTVSFGSSGGTTKFAVDSGTSTLGVEQIPIYNPDSVSHDFFCLADPSDPASEGVLVGVSPASLFGLYETGLSLPGDFPFSNGYLLGTGVVSGTVTLLSGTSGYYYTPVVDLGALEGRRFFFSTTVTGTGLVDETSSVDSVSTVGVRLSDTAPSDVGWSSGQLSTDPVWSVSSGTLSFEPMENGRILDPHYQRYIQARVEFSGVSAALNKIGVEEGHKLTIPAGASASLYVRSLFEEHVSGRNTPLLVWYVEARNEIV